MTKAEFRSELKARLFSFRQQDVAIPQQKILEQLKGFFNQRKSTDEVWGSYQAILGEPDLSQLHNEIKQIAWAFPKMLGDSLSFYEVGATGLVQGDFQVSEPELSSAKLKSLDQISGVIIPGLGFDQNGVRLGRGRGFYDRSLANFKGLKVGVAWSCQFVQDLPCDQHDLRVDWLVTQDGLHAF